MAEGKKSFILYCDLIHTVGKLPNEKAGELFKFLLEYVNDLNPQTDDLLLQISFEPIKQQLKRDLISWKETSVNRSISGQLGGIKSGETRRKQKEANEASALILKQKEANEAVNVTVTVTDTVNVKKDIGDKSPSLEERKENFRKSLIPYLETYGKEMLRAFFDYWSESNEGGKKMLFEMKKTFNLNLRLSNWKAKENSFKKQSEQKPIAIKPKANYDKING